MGATRDPGVRGQRIGRGKGVPTPPVRHEIRASGHRATCRGGAGARAVEWAGDSAYFAARVGGIRQAEVCAPSGDFGIPPVQPVAPYGRSEGGGGVRIDALRQSIAERRRQEPHDICGWTRCIRGDWQEEKGVYHINQINAVDTVTQWQVIGCTSKISEQYLLPVREAMLHRLPFRR
jgi:hypothetical protein